MGVSNHSVGIDPFQSDISQNASSSGNTLHSGKEGCFRRMDHSVRSVPLQSGAFGNSSSGVYPSFFSDTPG